MTLEDTYYEKLHSPCEETPPWLAAVGAMCMHCEGCEQYFRWKSTYGALAEGNIRRLWRQYHAWMLKNGHISEAERNTYVQRRSRVSALRRSKEALRVKKELAAREMEESAREAKKLEESKRRAEKWLRDYEAKERRKKSQSRSRCIRDSCK